jgi:hypothetical protein
MLQATRTICLGCLYVPKGWERDMGFGICSLKIIMETLYEGMIRGEAVRVHYYPA